MVDESKHGADNDTPWWSTPCVWNFGIHESLKKINPDDWWNHRWIAGLFGRNPCSFGSSSRCYIAALFLTACGTHNHQKCVPGSEEHMSDGQVLQHWPLGISRRLQTAAPTPAPWHRHMIWSFPKQFAESSVEALDPASSDDGVRTISDFWCGPKCVSNGEQTIQYWGTFGSWDVRKVHGVVEGSTFPSESGPNTVRVCSEHFWTLKCSKRRRLCSAKHVSKSKW